MKINTFGNLSNKDHSRLKQASRIAAESDVHKYKLGAVIERGGRVLAVGVNSYRTYGRHYRETDDFPPRSVWTYHAEEAALKAVGMEANGATLYVSRVNKRGDVRMAKPCKDCMELIKKAGIKRIVYTIDSEMSL